MNELWRKDLSLARLSMPLARPFRTARGEVTHRDVTLLRVEARGVVGVGEVCPLPGFSAETHAEAEAQLRALCPWLAQAPLPEGVDDIAWLLQAPRLRSVAPSVRFGVEVALLDWLARYTRRPMSALLSSTQPPRAQVPVNATITAPDVFEVVARAQALRAQGFGTFKLKVGALPLDEDVARVHALREAVGPEATIRLDANGAWTLDTAREALTRMAPAQIALIEQPAEDLDDLAALRALDLIRVAADEAIRDEDDLTHALERDAIDALVLKPALTGLLASARMASRAAVHGVRTIYTSLLDGAIGRAAVAHLAAVSDHLEGPCGLATGDLFTDEAATYTSSPDTIVGGALCLRDGLGHGVSADRAAFVPEVCAPDDSFPHPLMHRAMTQGDHLALIAEDDTWRFSELYASAAHTARVLYAQGVRSGQRVAIAGANTPETALSIWAVSLIGAVAAPIHPRWTRDEAAQLISRARCAHVLALDTARQAPTPQGVRALSLDHAPADEAPLRTRLRLSDVALILFTSGTTSGLPKLVPLTWQNLVFSATGSAIHLGHLRTDRWLATLPICHIAGLSVLWRCALLGTTAVLHERFDAARVAQAIEDGTITLVSLVAAQLAQVIEALGDAPAHPTFRAVLLGGGTIPPTLLDQCRVRGLPVAPTYGMTEGSSQLLTRPPHRDDEAHSVGSPLVWTEIMLLDEAGAPSDEGAIFARSLTVGPGYAEPVGERLALRPHGRWLATGDWARRGEDGSVQIMDRRVDRIVSGGENISPVEVEEALLRVEGVAQACVVGVPDPVWGHRPVAVLVAEAPDADTAALEAALRATCADRLAPFKHPSAWVWWDDLPRTTLHKLNRRAVRERLDASEVLSAASGPASVTPQEDT